MPETLLSILVVGQDANSRQQSLPLDVERIGPIFSVVEYLSHPFLKQLDVD